MKVIHLSLSSGGGAGVAAARGVQALRARNVEAELWTANGGVGALRLYPPWWFWLKVRMDAMPQRLNRRKHLFASWSNNTLPSRLARKVNRAVPDIVHLHWVGAGFLNFGELAWFNAPVVWTLHDTWPFTGGCHYPGECDRFVLGCGMCPQLGSGSVNDASRRRRGRNRQWLSNVAGWIAPSGWMAGLAVSVGGLPAERVHVVPNGLDASLFSRGNRAEARAALSLPVESLVLVAGAHDLGEPRKGGHLLSAAMVRIVQSVKQPVVLFLFGEGAADGCANWPCEVRHTGYLRSESELARIFRAADLLLMPSLQDNLPNIAVEALACGCPVAGFDRGGLREIVEHGRTGWLTDDATSEGLGYAVLRWLESAPNCEAVSGAATERVAREFSLEVHSRRLYEIYAALLHGVSALR